MERNTDGDTNEGGEPQLGLIGDTTLHSYYLVGLFFALFNSE